MTALTKWSLFTTLQLYFTVLAQSHTSIEYQRYDGWFNNLANPSWGTVASPLSRVAPAMYEDGVYQPAGSQRPKPLELSEELMSDKHYNIKQKSFRNASVLMVFFGQHVAHEIVDTSRPGCPPEHIHLQMPAGQKHPIYGDKPLPFVRSNYDSSSGKSPNTPRQQINEATAWLDGSAIYGTSKTWADHLRSHRNGTLHRSKMGNWPENNTIGLPMYNLAIPSTHELRNAERIPKVGNKRGNENPFLLSIAVIWFRYHNLMAVKIKQQHPTWTDDKIYNEARKWVIATYQHIVLYEWLPAFLGLNFTSESFQKEYKYKGYKPSIHPGVTHIFQSAAMRYAETMVPSHVTKTYTQECDALTSQYHGVRLCNNYWNAEELLGKKDKREKDVVKPIIYGMANQMAEAEDSKIVDDLRVYAYGPLHFSRRDLAALTIQRGRDHGLPDYNTARKAFGLAPMKYFEDINNDTAVIPSKVIERMKSLYGDIDDVDIWVGGLMESSRNGPGELFSHVILDQFLRLRDGDRFWYENYKQNRLFEEHEIERIKNTTFKDVIVMCTDITRKQLQDDVFFATGAKCPVKRQGRVVEQCQKLETYDYFSGSQISFALSFLLIGLLPFIAVGVLCALAHKRNTKREKQIAEQRRKSQRRSVNKEDRSRFAAIEWENKTSSRVVTVALGPGTSFKILSNRNHIFRIIDLQRIQWLTTVKQSDKLQNTLSIRLHREYDLVLSFPCTAEREKFFQYLVSFLQESCPNIEIQEYILRTRELFNSAVTREARQQKLEKFFRAAFARAFDLSAAEDPKTHKLTASEIKEILSCELSQTEFADALSMQSSSPFVLKMFDMADKDHNGYINFREFLDLIFIFAKGTPEDKLKLFFDMYDIDGDGTLDKEEFKKMMRSLMDVVNASVVAEDLDQLVESMFMKKEHGDTENLSFDDFGSLILDLDKQEGLLNDVKNVFQEPTKTTKEKPKKKQTAKRKVENKANITRQRHSTLIARESRTDQTELSPEHTPSKRNRRMTLAQINKAPKEQSAFVKQLVVFSRFIENHRQHIFILSLYTLVMFGFFAKTAYKYAVQKEHAGLRRVTGYGVIVSRGAASAMMFTFSTLLVTMSRNTITFLRETLLMHWIPFDSAIAFHKYVAYWALLFTVIHTIGHAFNFYHLGTQSPTDLSCLLRNDFHRSHVLPKFHYYCWQTITGVTGVILCIVIVTIYVFASQFSRRAVFNWFWWTHQLYIALYAFTILHGSGHLLQSPTFYLFLLGPAVLFTVDKLISMARKKVEIPVTKAQLLPSDVTHLEFKRPVNFNYKSGQWVRIACLDLAGSEYHPFTLTSAPHEENLSLHIRAVGPWTMNIRNTYNKDNLQDRPFPKLYLDGPFGEGHQDWYRFEVSVLVGGGIGVTPFASILKDIAHKGSLNSTFACKQVYFLWVTRTQKHFEWLTDIIKEVEEKDTKKLVTVHIFITQFYEKFDLRTTMLYICERHFQKISGKSLFTGLKSTTHFGRPDFDMALRSICGQHPEVGKVGVFSCGPPTMTRSVEKTCAQLNLTDGPTYSHHFENF